MLELPAGNWDTLDKVVFDIHFLIFLYYKNQILFIDALPLALAFFGQGKGNVLVDDLICNGTEQRLLNCRFTTIHNCNHSEDAGVRCQGME